MEPQYLSSLVPAPTSESSRFSFQKLPTLFLWFRNLNINIYSASYLSRAIILWNSLPAAFQNIKTLAHFKFQLKLKFSFTNTFFFPIFGFPSESSPPPPFTVFFSFFSLFLFPIPIPIFIFYFLFRNALSLDKYTCPTFLQSWFSNILCV